MPAGVGKRIRRGTYGRAVSPEPPRPVQGGMYAIRVAPPGSTYGSVPAEPGRIVRLDVRANPARAARMLDLGYLIPFEGKPFQCRVCGAEFAEDAQRTAHGKRTHEPAEDPAARALRGRAQELRAAARRRKLTYEEESELDALEKQAATALEANERAAEKHVASPYMDRTAASRA